MDEFRRGRATTVTRNPEHANYDREYAYQILDSGLVCHVGFEDLGRVFVIPMVYARRDEVMLLHGSIASRLMKSLGTGLSLCVTVTLLDGLVLAKSVFSHTMNYRSVVVLGKAHPLAGLNDKREALRAMTEQLIPGRWDDARHPSNKELMATTILQVPLHEASVKARSGPPQDLAKDADLPIWAGVIPLGAGAGPPIPASNSPDVAIPDYVQRYCAS